MSKPPSDVYTSGYAQPGCGATPTYPSSGYPQQQQQTHYPQQPPPPAPLGNVYPAAMAGGTAYSYPTAEAQAVAIPALDTPPNMIIGDASDSVALRRRHIIPLVICCVAGLGAIACLMNVIVKFSVGALVAFILLLGLSLGSAFFCSETVAEFNKRDLVFRLMRRRLLFALCDQRDVLVDVPLTALGEPFVEASEGKNGAAFSTLWLPVQGHPNVQILRTTYSNEVDMQRDLNPWKLYVNRMRGHRTAQPTFIQAVGQGIAQAPAEHRAPRV